MQNQTKETKQTKRSGRLTESDWVNSAMEIMLQENIKGIKITTLCSKLGVTKGSFYWHFTKRSDLLVAMLKEWRKRMTMNVIRSIGKSGQSGLNRIRHILKSNRHPRADHFSAIEMNIRDWSRRNELPRDAIDEVDNIRIKYYEQIFLEEGYPADKARHHAYLAYCITMGDAILNKTLSDYVSEEEFIETSMGLLHQDK